MEKSFVLLLFKIAAFGELGLNAGNVRTYFIFMAPLKLMNHNRAVFVLVRKTVSSE